MKTALYAILLATLAAAQNPLARPDPYAGTFAGDGVTLELSGSAGVYTGALTVQGQRIAATVRTDGNGGTGAFEVNGQTYRFTLTPQGTGFKLASAGAEYRLERKGNLAPSPTPGEAAAPAGSASPAASGSIVGLWRTAQGSATFNADGTGVVDGNPCRYVIKDDQLTMIGAQGQITVRFTIAGDTLTLTGTGGSIAMTRVKQESGPGSIHAELVGKWCWMSQVYANNGGGRQSNRCITLDGNGAYLYEGMTDSYNPNGGGTSQSSDAGTWTATETTFTARSRSGKTTVYQLEKRNHPKNKSDPMIVLNGEPFVTTTNRPPW